jgi:hypothetical protein
MKISNPFFLWSKLSYRFVGSDPGVEVYESSQLVDAVNSFVGRWFL